ncbi:hybrid sensor histidine kinase/response regulator [Paracoccus benzoatiresistens]|uniref:histidine kinase n=1 Tax=Paracoccus benzoatiresistens TaxID=2997341 RepID=A0ABT4J9G8_9RHOB|nr:response regulator [Paracoccus sp. EF6]MCZ0963733.1 response regulator [Paracoccus sp. EF6]
MNGELDLLRARFGRFLVILLWAHVPLIGVASLAAGTVPVGAGLFCGALLAAICHLAWARHGIAPITRNVAAVVLIGEPALLLLVFEGHPWQMDMHMYFFVMLALNIGWFDRAPLLLAAVATTVHHLMLSSFLPAAVFVNEGNVARVGLHGAIVAFQTLVLVWVSDKVLQAFARIARMRDEILQKSLALEERTREAEDATRAKSMFLANISHEIRTPINAILGFCHLLQRTALQPRQADQVAKIGTSGKTLLRLINDLLDFSKNEAGQLTLESRPFDLRQAIMCQVQMVSETARAKGLELRLDLAPDLPPVLLGDDLRLNQVLLNLLGNAIKFSDRGTVTLSAREAGRQDGQAVIECRVRDTGIGMTPPQQARLFTPFTQADSSTTRRFGGTGLGLTICKQIIEQMGGSIHAASRPGEGSTFTFRVPLLLGDASLAGPALPGPGLRGLRVLVADDNPIARQIIAEILAGWQMEADLAPSGQKAVEMLRDADRRDRPYNLLILDWKMPDMDGLQVLQALRADTGLRRPPATLVTTGYGVDDLVQQAGCEPIGPVLAKPIDAPRLLDALNQLPQLADGRGHAASAAPVAALELPPALQGQRVLLVEDNEINREIGVALLSDAGLLVDCAENGLVACRMVGDPANVYAAILMDIQMPEMDGITAARHIRGQHSAADLPIIAMTSHVYEEERRRSLEAGMVAHVAKPVDPALLVAVLASHLRPVAEPVPGSALKHLGVGDLPDRLDPFDIPAALRRVNGKAGLLRRLILSFADTHATVAGDLAGLIAANRLDEAHRLAHSLKGVSASLELAIVPALAARIEALLDRRQLSDLPGLLDRLAEAIGPAVAAARTLSAPHADRPAPAAATTGADPARIDSLQDRLRDQIRRRSLSARSCFEDLADALHLDAAQRHDHPVRRALQNLDYALAARLLDPSGDKGTA